MLWKKLRIGTGSTYGVSEYYEDRTGVLRSGGLGAFGYNINYGNYFYGNGEAAWGHDWSSRAVVVVGSGI